MEEAILKEHALTGTISRVSLKLSSSDLGFCCSWAWLTAHAQTVWCTRYVYASSLIVTVLWQIPRQWSTCSVPRFLRVHQTIDKVEFDFLTGTSSGISQGRG